MYLGTSGHTRSGCGLFLSPRAGVGARSRPTIADAWPGCWRRTTEGDVQQSTAGGKTESHATLPRVVVTRRFAVRRSRRGTTCASVHGTVTWPYCLPSRVIAGCLPSSERLAEQVRELYRGNRVPATTTHCQLRRVARREPSGRLKNVVSRRASD